jgi:hypothetical protein
MITNITDYKNNRDWFFILVAALVVEFVVIVFTRYAGTRPFFSVTALNHWYNKFGVLALGSDVFSVLIGVMGARYIYTLAGLQGSLYFLLVLVAFQLAHDIFFYEAIIKPIPVGHNQMIDVFKNYAKENGAKILVSDALIVLATATGGSFLKSLPDHYTVATGFVTLYSLCYILYTKSP